MGSNEVTYTLITGDEVNSFLAAIMRTLTEDQKIALRDALIERTPDDQDELWNKVVAKVAANDLYQRVRPNDIKGIAIWKEKQMDKLKRLYIISKK